MLFTSAFFIFLFLPLVLAGFYYLVHRGRVSHAFWFLIAASLIFYGWWKPVYLALIISSIVGNYLWGFVLGSTQTGSGNHGQGRGKAKLLLAIGVGANLASIGWFKYANFFVETANAVVGTNLLLETILLPLAISFFTFQQIAYLVDIYRGEPQEKSLRNYALFVTFFPQLIAGPIVHHKEMLPQFLREDPRHNIPLNLSIGLSIFSIGLFKKVILADGVAGYSDAVFSIAADGVPLSFLEAWLGALAYTCQLYFDFSGYSDMAVGLARLFGIRLPLNFNSPYKALNIIDFWRRWHMTLSRFLRDYLYIPLGGSRGGQFATYKNLFLVMLLGGLWHGAGWTFIAWGALHGLYLLINHAWRGVFRKRRSGQPPAGLFSRVASRTLTFLAVVVAWVYFRAESMEIAHTVLAGMLGFNGIALPEQWLGKLGAYSEWLATVGIGFQTLPSVGQMFTPVRDLCVLLGITVNFQQVGVITAWLTLTLPLLVIFFLPNTQQIMYRYSPAFEIYPGEIEPTKTRFLQWTNNRTWAVIIAFIGAYGCFGGSGVTRFLYFNF